MGMGMPMWSSGRWEGCYGSERLAASRLLAIDFRPYDSVSRRRWEGEMEIGREECCESGRLEVSDLPAIEVHLAKSASETESQTMGPWWRERMVAVL